MKTILVSLFALLFLTVNVNAQKEEPVQDCDVQAEFPGGTIAMLGFLKENLKYPEQAKAQNIQGRVIVQFVVEKDGTVSDMEVVKPIDPLLDAEAVRVVSLMPLWKPGMKDGKPVRVQYSVPLNFRISKPQPKRNAILVEYAKAEGGIKNVTCTVMDKDSLSTEQLGSMIGIADLEKKMKDLTKKKSHGFFTLPNNEKSMDEFNALEDTFRKYEKLNVVYKQR